MLQRRTLKKPDRMFQSGFRVIEALCAVSRGFEKMNFLRCVLTYCLEEAAFPEKRLNSWLLPPEANVLLHCIVGSAPLENVLAK